MSDSLDLRDMTGTPLRIHGSISSGPKGVTPAAGGRAVLRRDGLRASALVALAFVVACGGSDVPATIERDAFVQTYADLRVAAVQTDSQRISMSARDSILAAHGVTAGDLELFAEVHSADLDFMRDVWNDIERLMDRESEEGN